MDKYEFNLKVEQLNKLVKLGDYKTAMRITDTIDWRRVHNAGLLTTVSQVYERNGEYKEAREILLLAYDRAPVGKRILYRLAMLAIKEGDIAEAEGYYKEYIEISPQDSRKYIMEYLMAKARDESLDKKIRILEKYNDIEVDEQWKYELATLYSAAGRVEDCVKVCDEIMLLFAVGENVEKAAALKESLGHPLSMKQLKLVENKEFYEDRLKSLAARYDSGVKENFPDLRLDNISEYRPREDIKTTIDLSPDNDNDNREINTELFPRGGGANDTRISETTFKGEIVNPEFEVELKRAIAVTKAHINELKEDNPHSSMEEIDEEVRAHMEKVERIKHGRFNDVRIPNKQNRINNHFDSMGLPRAHGIMNYDMEKDQNTWISEELPGTETFSEEVQYLDTAAGNDTNTVAYESRGMSEGGTDTFGNFVTSESNEPAYESQGMSEGGMDTFGNFATPESNEPVYESQGMSEGGTDTFGNFATSESNEPAYGSSVIPESNTGTLEKGIQETNADIYEKGKAKEINTGYIENESTQETKDREKRSLTDVDLLVEHISPENIAQESADSALQEDANKNLTLENEPVKNITITETPSTKVLENYVPEKSDPIFDEDDLINSYYDEEVETAVPTVSGVLAQRKEEKDVFKSTLKSERKMEIVGDEEVYYTKEERTFVTKVKRTLAPVAPIDEIAYVAEDSFEEQKPEEKQKPIEIPDIKTEDNISEKDLEDDTDTIRIEESVPEENDMETNLPVHGKVMKAKAPKSEEPREYLMRRPGSIIVEGVSAPKALENAIEVLKEVNELTKIKHGVLKIKAAGLNAIGVKNSMEKIKGKDLIIEEAGALKDTTIAELIEFVIDGRQTVVFSDSISGIAKLIGANDLLHSMSIVMREEEEEIPVKRKNVVANIVIKEREEDETLKREEPLLQGEELQQEEHESLEPDVLSEGTTLVETEENVETEETPEEETSYKEDSYKEDSEAKPENKVINFEKPQIVVANPKVEASEDDDMSVVLSAKDFVEYAIDYANKIDCVIPEKTKLAIEERVDYMKEDETPLTRKNAITLIEGAADLAENPGIIKKIFGFMSIRYDKEDRLILREEHFKV